MPLPPDTDEPSDAARCGSATAAAFPPCFLRAPLLLRSPGSISKLSGRPANSTSQGGDAADGQRSRRAAGMITCDPRTVNAVLQDLRFDGMGVLRMR